MNDHHHYYKLVAHIGRHLYYECHCTARRHGISATGTAKRYSRIDQPWLDGAVRAPEEGLP